MKIRQFKQEALFGLRGRWGLAIGIIVLSGLVGSAVPNLAGAILASFFEGDAKDIVKGISQMLLSLLLTPITIGASWMYLNIVRREHTEIADLFSKPFSNSAVSGKLILASFLMGLYTILWSLLLIVPGIIKSLAYSQTGFILKDHPEYSANQAITFSRKLMDGQKWRYFLLCLSFIGWGILSIFTLFIGLLWLIPYMNTTQAAFYNEISGFKKQDEEGSSLELQ
ncbi:DUF975 family protein [Peribacillus kribbensis]|uniref:DUF975 family protein n=1 Tax=Peribacillus kribbensis TaxID=356658 RepID=UPI0004197A90|nr:DUF975 family protein [Peribacillus kribbensis]